MRIVISVAGMRLETASFWSTFLHKPVRSRPTGKDKQQHQGLVLQAPFKNYRLPIPSFLASFNCQLPTPAPRPLPQPSDRSEQPCPGLRAPQPWPGLLGWPCSQLPASLSPAPTPSPVLICYTYLASFIRSKDPEAKSLYPVFIHSTNIYCYFAHTTNSF